MDTRIRDNGPDEALLADLDWEAGEHPPWWTSTSLIWVFAGTDSGFATSDLTQAAHRLWTETHQELRAVRQALMGVPRVAGDHAVLLGGAVRVEAHHLFPYLKGQARALVTAEVRLKAHRETTVGDVLRTVTALLEGPDRALANRIFDPIDELFSLGVEPKQLQAWAREFKAYEVDEFVISWIRRERERRREAERERPPRATKALRTTAQERGIQRFVRYFGFPDFEPETSAEAEALGLHRAIDGATTAAEEEARTEARDAYICAHVLEAR